MVAWCEFFGQVWSADQLVCHGWPEPVLPTTKLLQIPLVSTLEWLRTAGDFGGVGGGGLSFHVFSHYTENSRVKVSLEFRGT